MVDAVATASRTQRMLDIYMEEASATLFLSSFFKTPPRNIHRGEQVDIDVIRDDEDVAIVIQDLSSGTRENENSRYTAKGFIPPIYDESGTITAWDLIKRQAGQDPFQDPDFLVNASEQAFRLFRKLERKIRRAIELMASQVLQLGVLTLVDSDGATLYTLDFSPKATHLVTTGSTWAAGAGAPLADLESLGDVVRRDGKHSPNILIFGQRAMNDFLATANVRALLDNRRITLGEVEPQARGGGASFRGRIWIGHYVYEMWMYDGFFTDPQTGNATSYVDTDKVIMLSESGRLDLSFGAIPMLRPPEERALAFIPPRMSDGELGIDLTTNSWFTADGKHLKVSAGTRPLTIPTAIDTFASIITRP